MKTDLMKQFAGVKAAVFDFDGVFTDNTVKVDQNGVESVSCWRSDGIGLSRIRSLGVKVLILSTESNQVVAVRANKLEVECIHNVKNKAVALITWVEQNKLSLDTVAFVGNDINDISVLKIVGIPIGVSDAYPEVLKHAKFMTEKKGGYGAVREVCDWIYSAQNKPEDKNVVFYPDIKL